MREPSKPTVQPFNRAIEKVVKALAWLESALLERAAPVGRPSIVSPPSRPLVVIATPGFFWADPATNETAAR